MEEASTLFEKVWAEHVVADLGNGFALLYVDRHLLHDGGGPPGLREVREKGYEVRRPDLTFGTPDHIVSTAPHRDADTNPRSGPLLREFRELTRRSGIRLFDLGEEGQGIVHVTGPEMGLSLPGSTVVCGDSHTCTHGGVGALAFGIGASEIVHVLATQCLVQKKPPTMRVLFEGRLPPDVTPKDLILALIGQIGTAGATGFAVEYAGGAIRTMPVEGRLTVCNLSIELGAKMGMVAPDEVTFEYLAGRLYVPAGAAFEAAVTAWKKLRTDDGAVFDREVVVDVSNLSPRVTWGTSPQDVIGVDGRVPDPSCEPDAQRRDSARAALDYMGLEPGQQLQGTSIDWVFIGSCTNGRISDLRSAAAVARGRRVASGVRAWVVPGSELVKRAAEAEGLDRIFLEAGFEWREPGCSLCVAANGEIVEPGRRCVSTSNRNFIGRQGPGARTHLASPATAAASAVTGAIASVRDLES